MTIMDGKGITTLYEYNTGNQLSAIIYPMGGRETFDGHIHIKRYDGSIKRIMKNRFLFHWIDDYMFLT